MDNFASNWTRRIVVTLGFGLLTMVAGCMAPECTDPDGCGPIPEVEIMLSLPEGTYATPQTLNISAPDAVELYVSFFNQAPNPDDCYQYESGEVQLNHSKIIRILAVGDGVNYRNANLELHYIIENPEYPPRDVLDDWLTVEKQLREREYAQNNDGLSPFPGFYFLGQDEKIIWETSCKDGYPDEWPGYSKIETGYSGGTTFYRTTAYFACLEGENIYDGASMFYFYNTTAKQNTAVTIDWPDGTRMGVEEYTDRAVGLTGFDENRRGFFLVNCYNSPNEALCASMPYAETLYYGTGAYSNQLFSATNDEMWRCPAHVPWAW